MKKLNDEVKLSGELVEVMFDFIVKKGKFVEVNGLVGEFNKQIQDQVTDVPDEDEPEDDE